jgi:hypothetical protein
LNPFLKPTLKPLQTLHAGQLSGRWHQIIAFVFCSPYVPGWVAVRDSSMGDLQYPQMYTQ